MSMAELPRLLHLIVADRHNGRMAKLGLNYHEPHNNNMM